MRIRIVAICSFVLAMLAGLSIAGAQTAEPAKRLPILFVCGDSTAAPTRPPAIIQGWGQMVAEFFDTNRIQVENRALAGRSARTFIDQGHWKDVADKLQKGDFVLIQFGHNDTQSATHGDRYDLAGIGDEVEAETGFHTFGFYMKQMIGEAIAKGAQPIVLSPVPRAKWANGKIVRGEENHGPWAQEVAKLKNVPFVDVNAIIADIYDPIGQDRIKLLLFTPQDNTHTAPVGARLNAACVVKGIMDVKDVSLKDYLKTTTPAVVNELIAQTPKNAAALKLPPATQPAGNP